jgi:hypothetical protein
VLIFALVVLISTVFSKFLFYFFTKIGGVEKMVKSWVQEFKTFAMRENVIDLAVGVIIGGAFIPLAAVRCGHCTSDLSADSAGLAAAERA